MNLAARKAGSANQVSYLVGDKLLPPLQPKPPFLIRRPAFMPTTTSGYAALLLCRRARMSGRAAPVECLQHLVVQPG